MPACLHVCLHAVSLWPAFYWYLGMISYHRTWLRSNKWTAPPFSCSEKAVVQDVKSSPYNPWQKLLCYRISCFVIEIFASNKEFTSTRHQSILTCQTGSFLCCSEEAGNFQEFFQTCETKPTIYLLSVVSCGILKVEQCHFKSPILFFIISHMLPSSNCDPLAKGVL